MTKFNWSQHAYGIYRSQLRWSGVGVKRRNKKRRFNSCLGVRSYRVEGVERKKRVLTGVWNADALACGSLSRRTPDVVTTVDVGLVSAGLGCW